MAIFSLNGGGEQPSCGRYSHPCHGQEMHPSTTFPSPSGPRWWAHTLVTADTHPVYLNTALNRAKIVVQNVGDRAAIMQFDTAGSPGLSALALTISVQAGAKATVNISLDRTKVLAGSYGGRVAINYGDGSGAPSRKLEVRVYYSEGKPATLTDTQGIRVRLYRRDFTCANDQQRLNFPATPVDAYGAFNFGKLRPDTYDLLAYRAVAETPDGAQVSEMGRLDNVVVDARTVLTAKDVTLEKVNTIIGPENPPSQKCQPK